MSYEKVKQAKQFKVGLKETIKAIENGQAQEVILAEDAEPHILSRIQDTCQHYEMRTVYVDSMKELGKACGIDVGAVSVAIER